MKQNIDIETRGSTSALKTQRPIWDSGNLARKF